VRCFIEKKVRSSDDLSIRKNSPRSESKVKQMTATFYEEKKFSRREYMSARNFRMNFVWFVSERIDVSNHIA